VLLTAEQWRRYFAEPLFERSAFRFEAQPAYTIPAEQERIALWRTGAAKPADHNQAWHDRVARFTAQGRAISRVRVVRRPLTEYQHYSFAWSVPGNIEAGEDVRVLDLADHPDLEPLPRWDWWMFDDETVVRLDFNDDGTAAGRELVDEADLVEYRRIRDLACSLAIPFAAYVADHRS